jgi:hypothetical protein
VSYKYIIYYILFNHLLRLNNSYIYLIPSLSSYHIYVYLCYIVYMAFVFIFLFLSSQGTGQGSGTGLLVPGTGRVRSGFTVPIAGPPVPAAGLPAAGAVLPAGLPSASTGRTTRAAEGNGAAVGELARRPELFPGAR